MQAVQFKEPKDFQFIDVPEPPSPAPGDAVVKIKSVGICGTDYSGYLGKMPFFSYPRIPGHELGVEVAAIGEGVTNVAVGDKCCIEPYINCQKCYACERGFTNCCEHNQTLGVHCDGGLQTLYTIPARKLHKSTNLTFAQSALVETLAIGCHAVDRGETKSGHNVMVIGAGPIGLSVIEFAKVAGARVIVMDMNENRLAFVQEKMGVPDTIQVGKEDEEARLDAITDHQLADVVIDASGSVESMSTAMRFCAFGGKLVYVGITQQEIHFHHAPYLHRRELAIVASRNAPTKDFPRIVKLIEEGKINTDPWITHRAAFPEMLDAFQTWLKPETGVIKAVVEFE